VLLGDFEGTACVRLGVGQAAGPMSQVRAPAQGHVEALNGAAGTCVLYRGVESLLGELDCVAEHQGDYGDVVDARLA
jgi:hypothetical protein